MERAKYGKREREKEVGDEGMKMKEKIMMRKDQQETQR